MRIGIDFGTSFSKAAAVDVFGNPVVLKYDVGVNQTIPSVFYFDRDRGKRIGREAERLAQSGLKDNLIRDIKLKLTDGRGDVATTVLDGVSFDSVSVVAAILGFVEGVAEKAAAQRGFDERIDAAVVTIPVQFNTFEKRCVLRAMQTPKEQGGPGLRVLGLLKEPIAAALSYCWDDPIEDGGNVLVYDLGGGTCDVAVVRADSSADGRFVEVASDMIRVGGRDWDNRLLEYVNDEVSASEGRLILPPQTDLRAVAIQCKEALSDETQATMSFGILKDEAYALHEIDVTREQFEHMTEDILQETMTVVDDVIRRLAPADRRSISRIVCVGGSSNMPQVRSRLQELFPNAKVLLHQPEYAVARGAALYAAHCEEGTDPERYVRGKSSSSYGICVHDYGSDKDYIRNLITVGDELGTVARVRLRTPPQGSYADAPVRIFENDSTDTRCEMYQAFGGGAPICSFDLDFGGRQVGAGTPFEFAMTLDASGLLRVTVTGGSGEELATYTVGADRGGNRKEGEA